MSAAHIFAVGHTRGAPSAVRRPRRGWPLRDAPAPTITEAPGRSGGVEREVNEALRHLAPGQTHPIPPLEDAFSTFHRTSPSPGCDANWRNCLGGARTHRAPFLLTAAHGASRAAVTTPGHRLLRRADTVS